MLGYNGHVYCKFVLRYVTPMVNFVYCKCALWRTLVPSLVLRYVAPMVNLCTVLLIELFVHSVIVMRCVALVLMVV
jgi:hypothetical protein